MIWDLEDVFQSFWFGFELSDPYRNLTIFMIVGAAQLPKRIMMKLQHVADLRPLNCWQISCWFASRRQNFLMIPNCAKQALPSKTGQLKPVVKIIRRRGRLKSQFLHNNFIFSHSSKIFLTSNNLKNKTSVYHAAIENERLPSNFDEEYVYLNPVRCRPHTCWGHRLIQVQYYFQIFRKTIFHISVVMCTFCDTVQFLWPALEITIVTNFFSSFFNLSGLRITFKSNNTMQ